jgi:hypothetical protein
MNVSRLPGAPLRGQAMVEYLIGVLLVVLALIVPFDGNGPVVLQLVRVTLGRLRTFGLLIGLP